MVDVYDTEKRLHHEVAQKIEAGIPGVEVLAVELAAPDRFVVYIDHATGVDHALCERVTDVLRPYLSDFAVDVSSPGSERPLRTPAHFSRVAGQRISLRTAAEIAGRKRFRGELVSAGEATVKVATGTDAHVDIPYEQIVRANLIDER
ncbi:MAG: ribosome maturation factor RimP [Actinomycetota bacterium]|nr:ribosome maturation factor RimP [Actinomycetota bacterium]